MELYFKSYTERKCFQFSTSEQLSENQNWGVKYSDVSEHFSWTDLFLDHLFKIVIISFWFWMKDIPASWRIHREHREILL